MPREDRHHQREAKRARLLEAAITVVRREGPGVSMDEIAREAGVTKPIVYRTFGDREGLTQAVADRFASEIAGATICGLATALSARRSRTPPRRRKGADQTFHGRRRALPVPRPR